MCIGQKTGQFPTALKHLLASPGQIGYDTVCIGVMKTKSGAPTPTVEFLFGIHGLCGGAPSERQRRIVVVRFPVWHQAKVVRCRLGRRAGTEGLETLHVLF